MNMIATILVLMNVFINSVMADTASSFNVVKNVSGSSSTYYFELDDSRVIRFECQSSLSSAWAYWNVAKDQNSAMTMQYPTRDWSSFESSNECRNTLRDISLSISSGKKLILILSRAGVVVQDVE